MICKILIICQSCIGCVKTLIRRVNYVTIKIRITGVLVIAYFGKEGII